MKRVILHNETWGIGISLLELQLSPPAPLLRLPLPMTAMPEGRNTWILGDGVESNSL